MGPILGEVKPVVQGVETIRGGVGQEHADLAVLDPVMPARFLPGDTAAVRSLLGEGSRLDDEKGPWVRELVADVVSEFGPDDEVVPEAAPDEVLKVLEQDPGLAGEVL
jgi:hypothetical protein